jgi:hypothetical protein
MARLFGFIFTGLAGFVAGIFLSFLSTPLLWKLEDIVHIELAGHSGPSDWILMTGGGLGAAASMFLFYKSTKK